MTDLLLATNNSNKLEELRSLLGDLPRLQLLWPQKIGLELHVEESGSTYAENARLKAEAFAQASGLPSLADDSGLEVEALDGEPGLFSARYAPEKGASDADRRAFLLAQLEGVARPWPAVFRSSVCLADPEGRRIAAEGAIAGEIIPEERGSNGFGYDPIFSLPNGKTMAELSMEEKNRLSHRARAIAQIKGRIGDWLLKE